MTLAVRRLRIDDIAKLQALVVENFEAIEPGITVLDARLLLGHATIDVIGVDAAGTLVLGAVDFTASEEMLLRAVEAYSWCLEYPEALMRHYQGCQISDERPPRLLFVVERVPDAFHRKIKQLGFPEVDCVEVRHLEFDGVAAVYFETLLRLRRGAPAVRAVAPEAVEAPAADIDAPARPAAARGAAGRLPKLAVSEPPVAAPRASERPAAVREPAPVVSMVTRQGAVAARVERPRPAPEPVVLREPEPLVVAAEAEPIVAPAEPLTLEAPVLETALPSLSALPRTAPAPAAALPQLSSSVVVPELQLESAPPRVSFKDLAATLLGDATPAPVVPALAGEPAAAPLSLETPLVLESAAEPVIAPAPVVAAPVAAPVEPRPKPAAAPAAAVPEPALTVEALVASATPADLGQPETPDVAKQRLTALPQEFAGLNFPNDGVLTRQWMEFLNQMSSSK